MKTITLEGFVHCKPAEHYEIGHTVDGMTYKFFQWEDMKSAGYALVAPHTLTIEVPDKFNPNGQFIEALEAQKKKVMADFQKRVTEIDRQISQFQAITMEAA